MKHEMLAMLLLILVPSALYAHGKASTNPGASPDRRIEFPDTADHLTLAVDLHTHSVFSDGHVWPRTRVEEALRDGLDALAITEHLEWQPHRVDIANPDRNRAHEIAARAAADTELIVIPGSEITREMPVGHINAVFIEDANALLREPRDALGILDADEYWRATLSWPAADALREANRQYAFVFWNHPDWTDQAPDGIARPTEFHLAAFDAGSIHGVEIANGDGYSEEAFALALEYDLTLVGVSDIHELIDWDYEPHLGGHRPVTLVFASEHSGESIREALFARRTVVWYKNLLIGRAAHLDPLLDASLIVADADYVDDTTTALVRLENRSDARFILENRSDFTFMNSGDLVEVPPHAAIELIVKTRERRDPIELDFHVRNALVSPKQSARLQRTVSVAPR